MIEEGVISIPSFAVWYHKNLRGDLVIPSTVTIIGQEAFSAISGTGAIFDSITFAEDSQIKCINHGAFKYQSKITSIAFPEGLECLHAWVLSDCDSLKNVYIPSTITRMQGTNHRDYESGEANVKWDKECDPFVYSDSIEIVTFGGKAVKELFMTNNANKIVQKTGTKNNTKPALVATASIDLTFYTSLTTAVEAAKPGDTITLQKNTDEAVEIPAGVDFDKNNYTADKVTEAPNYVVEVDGDGYASFEAAIPAIKKNSYVKLLADVEYGHGSVQLKIPQSGKITIDLNGHNLTLVHSMVVNVDAELTVLDDSEGEEKGTFKQTSSSHPISLAQRACVDIVGVNFEGTVQLTAQPGHTTYFKINGKNIIGTNCTDALFVSNTTVRVGINDDLSMLNFSIGTVTLPEDFTVSKGQKITVGESVTLIVPENKKLTIGENSSVVVNGILTVNGKIIIKPGATLTAPEGLTVTTDVAGYTVKYEEGKYFTKACVVAIGDETYASITEALTYAKDGETIKLLQDITEDVTINKAVTINGNGKQYTGTMTVGAYEITIQNVKFVNGEIVKITTPISGTFRINDCTFEGETTSGYAIKIGYASLIEINRCESKGNSFLYVPYSLTNLSVSNTTIENANWAMHLVSIDSPVFTNVTIKNSNCGIVIQNTGNKKITIDGCTFTDTVKPIVIWEKQTNNVKFTFKGNTDLGTNGNVWAIANNNYVSDPGSQYADLKLATDATLKAPKNLKITAVDTNYIVEYKDGVYKVSNPVAKIGETIYSSLAAAIKAAKTGDTIILLKDVTENVTIDNAVTIEGKKSETENFQYTGKMTIAVSDANVTIQNVKFTKGHILSDKDTSKGTTLKISNCEFDGQNSIDHAMEIANFKQLIIEGGTIKNYKLSAVYVKSAQDNDVIINGTTIESIGSYAIRIAYGEGLNLNGVTIKNVYGGVLADTAKNYTFTNCTFENVTLPLTSWSYTLTGKFIFNETNTIPNLSTSNGGTFVLSVGATIKAPEGLKVTTDAENAKVVYENGIYSVHVHTFGEAVWENVQNETCTTDGSYDSVVYCTECKDKLSSKEVTIPAHNHKITMEMDPATGFGIKFYFDVCGNVDAISINDVAVSRDNWKPVSEGRYYYVEYNEIAAKDFAKRITVELMHGEEAIAGTKLETSVENYAKAELERKDISLKYVNLLNAMINYGAAANKYLTNKESCTIDNSLNGNYDACNDRHTDSYNLVDANGHYLGARVVGDSTLKLDFLFYFANTTEINVAVQFGNRMLETDEFDVISDTSKPGRYMVSIEIPAYAMSEVITCVAGVGNDTATITYSVESYAFESFYFADVDYGRRQELVDAMMAYGDAAARYAGNN